MNNNISNCYTNVTLLGCVSMVNPEECNFCVQLLTGDSVTVGVATETVYEVLRNVGDESRDRVEEPDSKEVEIAVGKLNHPKGKFSENIVRQLIKYIKPDVMVCIEAVHSVNDNTILIDARRIVLMHSDPNRYGWEDTHWWLQQVNTLFEQWLDVLFETRRELTENDFAEFYRTNLDLLGGLTGNNTQESATMSRFLYGLSSTYLLTGNERALSAARACVKYLINAYASPSHDGEYVFWKFGRVKDGNSIKEINSSLNPDDRGTYALYEQIYVLSGLTQYYRVTQDTWVLGYIVRTIAAFERFFLDEKRDGDSCFTGAGGYFSHIDPVTMRPDSEMLSATGNREKKNWNSIGDHIPAYLINLLVSIDPLPVSDEKDSWVTLRTLCRKILDDCVNNIIEHFQPESDTDFVNERFHKDWSYDHTWGWQQDRGIVGHNLKISWNLTRCGHYYISLAETAKSDGDHLIEKKYKDLSESCYAFARKLGHNMKKVGVDLVRGGIFDALERHPTNGMPTEFAWSSSKDFWQQEQAILAYYLMQGVCEDAEEKAEFLELGRHCAAFWNMFFIDHDNRKIFFRTTESGHPIVKGGYGNQGGHAIAGYHAFELNYLAHLYIRTFVDRGEGHEDSFILHYCPVRNSSITTLNVLPDFFRPRDLKIINLKINGLTICVETPHIFQIDISDLPDNSVIMVEYLPTGREGVQNAEQIIGDRRKMANLQTKYSYSPFSKSRR